VLLTCVSVKNRKKGHKKRAGDKHRKHTIEAEYRPRRHRRTQFQAVEYGDPNPGLTRQHEKARREGKRIHPTVFKSTYLSPLPKPNPHVRCEGKGHHKKCYAVDRKTGLVIGRPDKLTIALNRNGQPVQTPVGLAMKHKGFQEPEYDERLQKWKPKKSKRTLVPAASTVNRPVFDHRRRHHVHHRK